MKAVQKFSDVYLQRCKKMNTDAIIKFLDDFRQLHGRQKSFLPKTETQIKKVPSKLISIKMPEDLLGAFRAKTELTNTPYQTQIKQLMLDWVKYDKT